jgi:Tol biopolymer transport system component
VRTTLIGSLVASLVAVVAASGSGLASAGKPKPFPRSGLLVFSCTGCPGNEGVQLFGVRPDGSRFRPVAGLAGAGAFEPRWSPDGRRLASTRQGSNSIWISSADGPNDHQVTSPPDGSNDSSPSWSPKGSRIVFVRSVPPPAGTPGNYRNSLWAAGADGSNPRRLLTKRSNPVNPELSPGGGRLAFNDVAERMWLSTSNGTDLHRLGPPTLKGRMPRWSPDARRIAFIKAEGKSAFRLYDFRSGHSKTLLDGPLGAFGISWSPDGAWIAVLRFAKGSCDGCKEAELWIVDADAPARRRLAYTIDRPLEIHGLDWRSQS